MAIGAAALRQTLRGGVNLPEELGTVSAVSVKGGIVLGGLARAPIARVIAPAVTPTTVLSPTITMSGTINLDSPSDDAGRVEIIGDAGSAVSVTGTLIARATGTNGNGGLVETSSASVDFAELTVDTSAPTGIAGTWLIDPIDLTVDATAAATIGSNLANGNVTLQTTSRGASGPGNRSGTLDGAGHSISGLVVNSPGSGYSGLIGFATGASTISNINPAGGSISGGDFTGALVGSADGTGSIFNTPPRSASPRTACWQAGSPVILLSP